MNRYPLWKYAILVVALLIGFIYTLPNFFGEAPAVQVSSGKVTVKVDSAVAARVEKALSDAQIKPDYVQFEGNSVKARFADLDNPGQSQGRDQQGAEQPTPATRATSSRSIFCRVRRAG